MKCDAHTNDADPISTGNTADAAAAKIKLFVKTSSDTTNMRWFEYPKFTVRQHTNDSCVTCLKTSPQALLLPIEHSSKECAK